MANYAISGVWKDDAGVITHYAVHELNDEKDSADTAKKMTKATAIKLAENSQNSVVTIIWNYTNESWGVGTVVNVIGAGVDKYLRTKQDNTVRDNLAHLIDYGAITEDLS